MLPPAKTPSQVAAEGSETSQLPASTGAPAAIASPSARARARTWRLGRGCAALRNLLAIGAAPLCARRVRATLGEQLSRRTYSNRVVWLPAAGVRHRSPGLGRRQRGAFLQQFD